MENMTQNIWLTALTQLMKYLGIKHGYFLPSLTYVDEPVNRGGFFEKKVQVVQGKTG